MTRKTQYSIIIYGITFAILASITLSAWFGTKKLPKTKGKKTSSSDLIEYKTVPVSGPRELGPSSPLVVRLSFGSKVPKEITASNIPALKVELENTSQKNIFIDLREVKLKKYDYIKSGKSIPVVSRISEVIPWSVDPAHNQAGQLSVKPEQSRTLTYTLSDYFTIFPGASDIEWIIPEEKATAEGGTNPKEIIGVKRIQIVSGVRFARLFSKEGGSGLEKAAVVDGTPVYEDEFIKELKAVYGFTLLNKLIAEKLVWKELKKSDVKVNQDDIDYAVEFEKRGMEQKLKGVPFEKYLKSKGLSEKELKESRGFLLRIAIRKFLSRTHIQDPPSNELVSYFDRKYSWYGREEMVQARKIVVIPKKEKNETVSQHSKEAALKKLLTIKEEIERKKVTFEEAVKHYSQDVRARVSQGMMDPFRRYSEIRDNDVPKVVADVGFRLKPGEISTPVETDEGFIILQVVKRIPPKKVLYKDVQDLVKKDYLYENITGDEIQKWIKGLVSRAKIEFSPGIFKQFAHWGKPRKLKHFETDLIEED
ncbi:peptidylprolyl isomerase [Planctomycetota bacterium]